MRIEHEPISPTRAAELLGLNYEGQRRLRASATDRYAADMASGNWRETGDTIKLNSSGRVIDGQHRLRAVIKAGRTIWFWVAYDVADDAYDVLDQGMKRRFSDVLQARGVRYPKLVASALASVDYYTIYGSIRTGGRSTSIPQLIDFWEANRDIERFAPAADAVYRATRFPQSLSAAMFYVFSITKTEDVERFAADIAAGEGLRAGDPAYATRQLLLSRMGTQTSRRYEPDHYTACVFRAWNAFAAGGTIAALRGRVNGKFPDVFDPHGQLEIWLNASPRNQRADAAETG